MRHAFRKALTLFALGIYSSLSLLGQGLHYFAAVDHHHHNSAQIGHSSHSNRSPSASSQADRLTSTAAAFAAGEIADEHDCEICEFLAQAISQPPSIAAPLELHEVVTDLLLLTPQFHAVFIVGIHAPRGPPSLGTEFLATAV